MVLINGKLTSTVDVTDRGLHYGDGLFETIEVIQQQPVFFAQHIARLKAGCLRLKLPFPDSALLSAEVAQLCANIQHGVLKIMLTRGSGGRGYRQPDVISVTRYLAIHPYPNYPEPYQQIGIKARFCTARLGINPLLAGIKHNNRLEQVLARAEWQEQYQEGLMLNIHEQVIEGTMSNIFAIKDQQLYTPDLNQSGIQGIMRQIILQQQPVKVATISPDFILQADELFITNSVIGVWPIIQLEQQNYAVGSVTQRVAQQLAAEKQRECAAC